jgi:hypothetical protein
LQAAVANQDPTVQANFQSTAAAAADAILPLLPEGTSCYVNPILETNLNRSNSEIVQEWVRPYFGDRCQFVWNPEGPDPGEPIPGAAVSEGHTMTPTFVSNACIADTDGSTVTTAAAWEDYFNQYSNCVAAMAWTYNDNCLSAGKPFEDPRARSCSDTSEFQAPGEALQAVLPPTRR